MLSSATAGSPSDLHLPVQPLASFAATGAEHTIAVKEWRAHLKKVHALYSWAHKNGLLANTALGGDLATGRPSPARRIVSRNRWASLADQRAFSIDANGASRRVVSAEAFSSAVHSHAAAGSAGKALILESTTSDLDNSDSYEAALAESAGFSVTEVSDAQWGAMTTADFEQYRVLIIGDPDCGDSVDTDTEAEQSAGVWEPAVMSSGGNKVLIGTDPVYHYNDGSGPNADVLIQNGIAYAGSVTSATGVYLDLSCTYNDSEAGSAVPILDGLSQYGSGQFTVVGTGPLNACSTNVNVIANTGPTEGLSDSDLSDWNCSVHEAFDKFPADYTPLALAPSSSGFPASYCGTDVDTEATACGSPYILISGDGIVSGGATLAEQGGAPSTVEHSTTCGTADPVNCATGSFWHTFTDATVPGNGVALGVSRTYSSADASQDGPFGYGWTDTYNMSLTLNGDDPVVTDSDGSQLTFVPNGSGGYVAPARVLATLVTNGDGSYTFSPDSTHIQYVFNSSGQLIEEVDRNGYETTLSYSDGELTKVTDPSGRELTFAYDSDGDVTSLTDPMGRTWTYTYDDSGNLTSCTDPMGRTWSFTYDANHLMLSLTDPRGGVTSNTYNSSGQVVAQMDPLGRMTTWAYDGNPASTAGSTTTITDPDGDVTLEQYENLQLLSLTRAYGTPEAATWTYEYDPNTLGISKETDPNGDVTTHTYDNQGNVLSTTDALGNETSYTYNSFDEVTSTTGPLGTTTENTYNSDGDLTSTQTPQSSAVTSTTTYAYGSGSTAGDITSVSDPDGNTTTYGYDAAGDQTSKTDALGNTTKRSYNADGQLTTLTSPDGGTTTYSYDADGEVTEETDPEGASSVFSYDADGNKLSSTDADGNTTKYVYDADNEQTSGTSGSTTNTTTYDADGNVLTQVDGDGNKTTYTYTPLGQVSTSSNADHETTSYTYDGDGNVIAAKKPDGTTVSYGYNADNDPVSVSYSADAAASVSETYNADGERTSMTDASGTTTFSYNLAGDLTSMTSGAGQTVSYQYGADGDVTSITYPNGKTVTRAYNKDGDLIGVTDWLGNTTHFAYNGDGALTQQSLPGSVTETDSYDSGDDLSTITDTNAAGTVLSLGYTHDGDGAVTQSTASGDISSTDNYSYNALGQLTADNASSYGYDAAGNATTYGSDAQSFDPADELTSSVAPVTATNMTGTTTPTPSTTPSTPSSATPTNSGVTHTSPTLTTQTEIKAKPAAAKVTELALAATKTASGAAISAPISVRAKGDVLVAFLATSGRVPSVSLKATGLVWQRLERKAAEGRVEEIWTATASRKLGRLSIHAQTGLQAEHRILTVVEFGPGASVTAGSSARSAKAKVALKVKLRSAGSQIWAIGQGALTSGRITALAGSTLAEHTLSGGVVSWFEHRAGSVASATATTGLSTPKVERWLIASIEVSPPTEPSGAEREAHVTSSPVLQTTTGTRSFRYNADGERTGETDSAGTASFSYNGADELTGVGSDVSYAYDADGLRTSETVNGTMTQFTWGAIDGASLLFAAGSTNYIYGPGGEPIEQVVNGTPQFLLGDRQGSTRLITDISGAVDGTYSYDAWGNVTGHTGSATTNLGYDGQYTDPETGFVYLRARYYDPSTGQFLTVDPEVSSTGEPYSYTNGNPLSEQDPSGDSATATCLAGDGFYGVAGGEVSVCRWNGEPGDWNAVTISFTGEVGVGGGADVSTLVGGSEDANKPKDLQGWGCDAGATAEDLGGVEGEVDCGGDTFVGVGTGVDDEIDVGVGYTWLVQANGSYVGGLPGIVKDLFQKYQYLEPTQEPWDPVGPSDGQPCVIATLPQSPVEGIPLGTPTLTTVPL